MAMESKFIWMNGEMVPFEQATLHILTPALHYGTAVFEGIRAYNTAKGPAVFRLREHTERLFDSARIFGFRELPWTVDQICEATAASWWTIGGLGSRSSTKPACVESRFGFREALAFESRWSMRRTTVVRRRSTFIACSCVVHGPSCV